jgi:hypothetical protein
MMTGVHAAGKELPMFCSNCGAKASGNFCSVCGAPLTGAGLSESVPIQDWSADVRYDVVTRVPAVRDLIAQNARLAKKPMSGEQFLEICDKAFSPIPGVSLAKVIAIVQPIYANLGIKTGKRRTQELPVPPGKALVGVLCSLARRGNDLRRATQGEDGCVLEAAIPSDLWSLEGDLLIAVRRGDGVSIVEAATLIRGQLFDWGKSTRCLNALFDDLRDVMH